MKKLKILSLLLLSLVFSNCSESDGQVEYKGDNALFFNNNGQPKRVILDGSVDFVTTSLEFATVKAPASSYQVKLVYDAENSTALPGVDFDVVNDVVTVEAGVLYGAFEVKFYEATAVALGKKAIFTLESDDVNNASFDNKMEVNISLSCQLDLETFPLTYDVEVLAFGSQADTHTQTFTVVTGQENTFTVPSMWGPNFVAWATGNPAYAGQFIYPATIVIGCDNSVVVTAVAPNYTGGSGTYDPATGIIDVVITQGVFTEQFDTQCIFYPQQ